MEKCTPSIRLAHLCEEHGEDDNQRQASLGSLRRRGFA